VQVEYDYAFSTRAKKGAVGRTTYLAIAIDKEVTFAVCVEVWSQTNDKLNLFAFGAHTVVPAKGG
jgi:hypothetical protein